MTVPATEIAEFLGAQLVGPDVVVERPTSMESARPGALLFASKYSTDRVATLNSCEGVLALVAPDYRGQLQITHIVVPRPRLAFAHVLRRFFAPRLPARIAPTAVVSASARLGDAVSIGDFSVIGDDVVIGASTEVRDHVVIRAGSSVGERCLIKSNTVIGEEGFGYEFEDDGTPIRIVHLGHVRIGDDVEIGAMNVIARGTLGDTVISNHVKTDDHVFIAHNAIIGESSVIIAGAEISGSVRIGSRVWISPQACIINQAAIGDDALVGIGAVVTKSVEANVIVVGNPARVLRQRHDRGAG